MKRNTNKKIMFTNKKIKKNQENSRKNLKNDTKINKQKFKTNSKPKSLLSHFILKRSKKNLRRVEKFI